MLSTENWLKVKNRNAHAYTIWSLLADVRYNRNIGSDQTTAETKSKNKYNRPTCA